MKEKVGRNSRETEPTKNITAGHMVEMKRSSPGAAIQQANNSLLFSLQVPPEVRSMHWWSRCRVGAEWLVGRNVSEDPPSLQDNIDCAES